MSATSDEPPATRRSRRWLLFPFGLFLILAVAVGWILVTGFMARDHANSVRGELAALRSDLTHHDAAAAAKLEARMQDQARSAHSLTTGPAWWVASKIPYLGGPARTTRGATQIVDELAHNALPAVVNAANLLNPHQLRAGSDQIDLAPLNQSAGPLQGALLTSQGELLRASALNTSWLGLVNNGRTSLISELTKLTDELTDLTDVATLLPNAVGQNGTKRYFVGFLTDAEPRGLGGLPGSWAILRAHAGHLRLVRFGSDSDLIGLHATNVGLGYHYRRQYRHLYHHRFRPVRSYANSDPSPEFPDAAKIWMSMWESKYHKHLDGAMTTDPTALSFLLAATGGVKLSDGTLINHNNVVGFFEHGIYSQFTADEGAPRKQFQEKAAKSIADRVIHEPGSVLGATASAVRRAVDQRRLLIYSTDPATEHALAKSAVGGVIPKTRQPYFGVVINNVAADKIGFYLHRTQTYQRSSCAAGPSTVTFTITNDAPPSGLVPYVTARFRDTPDAGSTIVVPALYSTRGSYVTSVTVDGVNEKVRRRHERRHPVGVAPRIMIKPGQTRTVVWHVTEPAATGPVISLEQPGVHDLIQKIDAPNCPVVPRVVPSGTASPIGSATP